MDEEGEYEMREVIDHFMSNYTSENIKVMQVLMVLVSACIIGSYIYVIYRLVTKKTFYSKSFNISLAVIAVVTSAIILAVQSSIVISLGMVGALSIVRFRTAVKEPMDLCFLFWSIAVGICCGARVMEIAIILSAILTILVVVLDSLPIGRAPMILILNLKDSVKEPEIIKVVKKYSKFYKVKSRNVSSVKCNLIVEVRVSDEYEMVQEISGMDGIASVSLVSHDGEVTF